jgi:hypothetical protein
MKMLFFSLVLALIIAGCGKGDDHAPSITVLSPQDNQTFTAGQTVHISASILDNSKINVVHVRVTNLNTGVEFIHLEQLANMTTYQYDQSFMAEAGVNYTIQVEANNYKGNDTQVYVHVKGQ